MVTWCSKAQLVQSSSHSRIDSLPVGYMYSFFTPFDLVHAAKTSFIVPGSLMLQLGLIHPSVNPLAAPLHMAMKNEAHIQSVGYYWCFNTDTIPDCYPLPSVRDFLSALMTVWFFSKIDLVWAYHQFPVNLNDIPDSHHHTFWIIWILVILFGLHNVASTFLRFIHEIVYELDFVFT